MKKIMLVLMITTFSMSVFANRGAVRNINKALDEVQVLRDSNPSHEGLLIIEDSLYDALDSLSSNTRTRNFDAITKVKNSSLIIASSQCRDVRADVESGNNVRGFMESFAQEIESFERSLVASCQTEARFPKQACLTENAILDFTPTAGSFNRCTISGQISPR